ncbi:MAG: L,D-transpeptidase [Acidaminococcaceae bacterium]
MKYEFGEERAKRKRRNKIVAALLVVALIILTGLGYMYFKTKAPVKDAKQAGATKVEETVATKPVEKKPEVVQNDSKPKAEEEKKPVPEYKIVIDKSEYSLALIKDGKVEKVYDVAIGKNPGQKKKVGDMKTPTGEFVVDEILDASYWKHDFKDGKGEIEGAYGPWFISLETGWDGIGIHGTHDPSSIKTMVSEGCVRMNNSDVEELKAKIQPGTKVIIQE